MLPKKNILLMASFVIAVLCCLIGVGAFILLISSPQKIAELNGGKQPDDLKAKIAEEKEKIANLNKMIEMLQEKLQKEQHRTELAQRIDQLINLLEATTDGLLEQLPNVTEQLTIIQAGICELYQSEPGGSQNHSSEQNIANPKSQEINEALSIASLQI